MTFGIISSTTEPFCDACDRSRLTADGLWYLCSTRPTAPTCGGRCGLEPRPISSLSSFAPRGKFAATAVPRSASRRETAHRSSPWIASSAILTSRCTPTAIRIRIQNDTGTFGSSAVTAEFCAAFCITEQCSSNAALSIDAIDAASRVSI